MTPIKRAYLSLGSNLGHRYALLQKAVFNLQKRAGHIAQASPIYETPAIGFVGANFLNACVLLETQLSPTALLQLVLQIERELGRERSDQTGYQSRTLDIDLIFYESEVIYTPALVVPHPRMHQRNFVLKPLADIAPQWYHPVLHKDTRNLLQQCKDRSRLEKTTLRLFNDPLAFFSQLRFIAIEGNIGAGKTTLAQRMARDFEATLLLEQYADNPFLTSFYANPSGHAFPLELSFLTDRYLQLQENQSLDHLTISDYHLSKSLIFAKTTLSTKEFAVYKKMFEVLYNSLQKPDLYVYLHQHTDRLLEHIKKRGRTYEQEISTAYLKKISTGYLSSIKTHFPQNSVIINMEDLDFVNHPSDYEKILARVEKYLLEHV